MTRAGFDPDRDRPVDGRERPRLTGLAARSRRLLGNSGSPCRGCFDPDEANKSDIIIARRNELLTYVARSDFHNLVHIAGTSSLRPIKSLRGVSFPCLWPPAVRIRFSFVPYRSPKPVYVYSYETRALPYDFIAIGLVAATLSAITRRKTYLSIGLVPVLPVAPGGRF